MKKMYKILTFIAKIDNKGETAPEWILLFATGCRMDQGAYF